MARFNAKDMKGYTTSGGTDTLITHTDSCEITFSTETIESPATQPTDELDFPPPGNMNGMS